MENNDFKNLASNAEKIDRQALDIFKNLPVTKPSGNLLVNIINEINFQKALRLRRKIAILASLAVISAFAVIYFWTAVIAQIAGSETMTLVKLIFSDLKVISADWQYYVMYFLETIPVMPLIYALISTFIAMAVLKSLILAQYNRSPLFHS